MQAFFSFAGRHANKSQYLIRTISLGTFLLLLFSCTVILLTRIAKVKFFKFVPEQDCVRVLELERFRLACDHLVQLLF